MRGRRHAEKKTSVCVAAWPGAGCRHYILSNDRIFMASWPEITRHGRETADNCNVTDEFRTIQAGHVTSWTASLTHGHAHR